MDGTYQEILIQIVSVTSFTQDNNKLVEKWHLRLGLSNILISLSHIAANDTNFPQQMGTLVYILDQKGEEELFPTIELAEWDVYQAVKLFIEHTLPDHVATWSGQTGLQQMTFKITPKVIT